MAAKVGKAPQRTGDSKRGIRVTTIAGELQRHAKVRRLSVQAVQLAFQAQRTLAATVDPWRDLFHQAGKAPQVGTARSLLLLGVLGQALQRVLADGAEQVVPRVAAYVIHAQERLVGEPRQQLEHALWTDAAPGGDLLGCGQREATREHCQPAENHALVLVQQVVAPVEGRPQGLVAARGRARATDQHREDVVETLGQLADGQHPHLGRG